MIQKGHFQTQMKYWTIGGGVQRRVPPPPGKKDHEIFASTWGKLAPSLSYRGPENLQRVAAKNRNWWNCEIWTTFLETQNFEPFLINMVRKIFYPLTGGASGGCVTPLIGGLSDWAILTMGQLFYWSCTSVHN
jgi:hypothetical protein